MGESVIEINLFDGFTTLKDGKPILTNLSNTRKTKLFVAYLMVNRDRAIPHKELFELLWSGEEYSNPGTALRTLLYRFRTMLENEGAVQLDNAVISKRGTYQWNKNLDIKIDVLDFEESAHMGLNSEYSDITRTEALKKAIDIYKGPLLPDFKSEPWMLSKAAYYRDLYARVVESYIDLLKKQEKYLEIAKVAEQAVALIGSSELIELEGTMARLAIAGGSRSNDRMESYYNRVHELSQNLLEDAANMQKDLEDDTVEKKAFICDYETFKEIYRLQRRMLSRGKSTLFLGLVDIRTNDADEDNFDRTMESVVNIFSWQLRCGDAVCRRKKDQMAILFPADSYEDAIGVLERLKRAITEKTGEDMVVVYQLKPLKNAKE